MIHTYDAQTAVELPRITSSEALTVGTSILAEASAEKKLAANVLAAVKHLGKANSDLQAAVFSSADDEGDPTFLEQSRLEGQAWSGAWNWAKSVAGLKNKKKAALGQHILDTLFPDGVAFVRLKTALRWPQTEKRVQDIAEHKLAATFAELGGSDFLDDVLDTHKALGIAAGITAPRGVAVKSGVQAAFDHWKAAMRCFVAQVIANQSLALLDDADDKAADELAKRLVGPLSRIETSSARGEGTGDGAQDEKKPGKKEAGKKAKGAGDAESEEPAKEPAAGAKPTTPAGG